jgi:hypothetical protein
MLLEQNRQADALKEFKQPDNGSGARGHCRSGARQIAVKVRGY